MPVAAVCINRLLFDSHEELSRWKTVFEDVIARSLGDDSVCIAIGLQRMFSQTG